MDTRERIIQRELQKYKLENVLLGLWYCREKYLPFQIASTTCFAMRFCTAGSFTGRCQHLTFKYLNPIINLITSYLISDPIGNQPQEDINSRHPYSFMLRIIGNQFIYSTPEFGNFAQTLLMFSEIPNKLKENKTLNNKFDFEEEVKNVCGGSVLDYIIVGIIAHAASISKGLFTREYFEIARKEMNNVPDANKILLILNQLAADPKLFQREFNSTKLSGEFEIYSPNPILKYPILRPWRKKGIDTLDFKNDRFIIPIPELIAYRISTGIYFQMLTKHGKLFTDNFGIIFENYVCKVLQHSISTEKLISEKEIRKSYPSSKGKAVDWVIIDGDNVILIECKATRINRKTLTQDDEDTLKENLKQVKNGLVQLHTFMSSCKTCKKGLEIFEGVTNFVPVLITFDSIYQANSQIARSYIDDLLYSDGISKFDWLVLSIKELEILQPHCSDQIKFREIIQKALKQPFNDVINELAKITKKTFKDSFLNDITEELLNSLRPIE